MTSVPLDVCVSVQHNQTMVLVNTPSRWTRYRDQLCEGCAALCCTMPLEVQFSDLVRLGWALPDEEQAQAATRLIKSGQIERYRHKTQKFTLARRADGTCLQLNRQHRCDVYENRPDACRAFPQVSSRPGYCPHEKLKTK